MRSLSKPDETTRHFLSLQCLNRSTTTSHSTLCVTTNHHINYLSSISNSLRMVARCHQQATHPRVLLKDLLKAHHPRPTSPTPHRTCLNNKTRSATSLQDHLPSNKHNKASTPNTLSSQHHQMARLLSTSSQAASTTNPNHPNPQP
jgi:hypothetical protein